jgi:hypothetical protein
VSPQIPVERLHHATVVVRDLHASARSYAEVYGIERWQVVHWSRERLLDSQAFGNCSGFSFSTATGANFYCFDRRDKLGGYVYEVICRTTAPPQASGALSFEFDFSQA